MGIPAALNRKELKRGVEAGLETLTDKLHSINPEFAQVAELKDLGLEQFIQREHQRPAGYSATTRAHAGRLCLPVLNDSGATCSCITEEALCLLINHTTKMLEEGKIKVEDYNYPIVHLFKYRNAATMRGAEKKGQMIVEYAVILRIEFIPEGAQSGPVTDIYFKVLKRGLVASWDSC